MSKTITVGFIGTGIMGSRIATNLQQQGYKLVIFNRTPNKENSEAEA